MAELPLSNLRIIELANVVAGPSVGKHLSDFGAEVIKVERPEAGDSTREMGKFVGSRSAWWLSIGRNKQSVTLDLKHPRGREALLRLVKSADALVESFLLGGRAIRTLALDPLLPEALVPSAERRALVEAMQRYDRVGRRLWAEFTPATSSPRLRSIA